MSSPSIEIARFVADAMHPQWSSPAKASLVALLVGGGRCIDVAKARRAAVACADQSLGRRVLEALEGQPDACAECDAGKQWLSDPHILPAGDWFDCPDCHGTGDNHRGYLAAEK